MWETGVAAQVCALRHLRGTGIGEGLAAGGSLWGEAVAGRGWVRWPRQCGHHGGAQGRRWQVQGDPGGTMLGICGSEEGVQDLQLCHSGVGDIDGGQQGEAELGFDLLSLRFPAIFRRRWRSCGLTEDEVAWGRTK